MTSLAQEPEHDEIRIDCSIAGALRSNFYENWMPREMIERYLFRVREFIEEREHLS